ncbi:unnamed protein product [Boreogadus saida]
MHTLTAVVVLQVCWAAVLWPCPPAHSFPVDCREEQAGSSQCPTISQEKLLDRVIQHTELIYRVSEESCSMFRTYGGHNKIYRVTEPTAAVSFSQWHLGPRCVLRQSSAVNGTILTTQGNEAVGGQRAVLMRSDWTVEPAERIALSRGCILAAQQGGGQPSTPRQDAISAPDSRHAGHGERLAVARGGGEEESEGRERQREEDGGETVKGKKGRDRSREHAVSSELRSEDGFFLFRFLWGFGDNKSMRKKLGST